jgi:hypothetical protein
MELKVLLLSQRGKLMMNDIKINGHIINGALLVDDPDVKRTFMDASGQLRHVRFFSHTGRLKSYLRRHPEGIILAGVGSFFFIEPVPVSGAMIRFDRSGTVDILVRDGAEGLEKQLLAIERICDAAAEAAGSTHEGSAC